MTTTEILPVHQINYRKKRKIRTLVFSRATSSSDRLSFRWLCTINTNTYRNSSGECSVCYVSDSHLKCTQIHPKRLHWKVKLWTYDNDSPLAGVTSAILNRCCRGDRGRKRYRCELMDFLDHQTRYYLPNLQIKLCINGKLHETSQYGKDIIYLSKAMYWHRFVLLQVHAVFFPLSLYRLANFALLIVRLRYFPDLFLCQCWIALNRRYYVKHSPRTLALHQPNSFHQLL